MESISRPLPPAKTRRTSTKGSSSPPPYTSSHFVFPKSNWDQNDNWTEERSREEISGLLERADSIIKDRESELSMTFATCRSLRSKNSALQSKHQALLVRHGITTSGDSPIGTPIHTPPHMFSDTSVGTHYSSNSYSQPRHVRKISISPSSIAQLSDQNAELLQKLEALESDQTAARALRKLEKEIRGLREELDATHKRGEELERNVSVINRREEDQQEYRREQIKAMRRSTPTTRSEQRDFAPRGSYLGFLKTEDSPQESAPLEALNEESPNTNALISALMSKVAELELANTQILAQQANTSSQLQAVQRETESMSRAYEVLQVDDLDGSGSTRQWEVQLDENELLSDATKGVIRFGSLRRKIDQSFHEGDTREVERDLLNLDNEDLSGDNNLFDSGLLGRPKYGSMMLQSTVRLKGKTRGSMAGLFDSTSTVKQPDTFAFDDMPSSKSAALSSISPETHLRSLPEHTPQTLEAELGGLDWMLDDDPKYHLRATSLYDLSVLGSRSPSRSPSPSPTASPVSLMASLPSMHLDEIQPRSEAVVISLEPPTPDKLRTTTRAKSNDTELSPSAARYRRMSQTVRMRTGHWVDGRFSDTLLSPLKKNSKLSRSTSTNSLYNSESSNFGSGEGTPKPQGPLPLPKRLASAFEAVTDLFNGNAPSQDATDVNQDAVELFVRPAPVKNAESGGNSLTKLMLEIWLWLQFAIIILLFVWAMAKRGPKTIIAEAGTGSAGANGNKRGHR